MSDFRLKPAGPCGMDRALLIDHASRLASMVLLQLSSPLHPGADCYSKSLDEMLHERCRVDRGEAVFARILRELHLHAKT